MAVSESEKLEAEQLAQEHWEWFQSIVGHVAKDFFVHGFKHGVDYRKKICAEQEESE